MSFSRREFLLGFGAGLLLPKTWDFYSDFLASHGEPYVDQAPLAKHTLYAARVDGDDGLRLQLDFADVNDSIPDFSAMTKRQFISAYMPDYPEEEIQCDSHLDEPVDSWYAFENWAYTHSPDIRAFNMLYGLDLGGLSEAKQREEGWIHFVNGPSPGNASRWVNIDPLGVSVLQQKLIELNLPVQLAMT